VTPAFDNSAVRGANDSESVIAPPATPPEPSQLSGAEIAGAAVLTSPAQVQGVQDGAPALVAENAGTGVATMVPLMKNPQNANKVAGLDVKVLPVGASQAEDKKNLPPPVGGSPTRAADGGIPEWNFSHANGGNHAPTVEASQFFNVVDLPSLAEARLRSLDRAHDMMALHAMRLVESKSDALSVAIKPAVGTELTLDLRQRAGGVEAQATLVRGDREYLSQHWPELQQRLEQRGIKLSPLGGTADFFSGNASQFRQQPSSQEQAALQASAFAEFAAAVPAGGATARLAVAHDGWESWA
jgi:hypothetical protein